MPDYKEIVSEIQGYTAVPAWDTVRQKYVERLHLKVQRNVILYYSAWLNKPESYLLSGINDLDMNGFMCVTRGLDKTKGLDLVLHTPGGNLAATEAIGEYLKKQFNNDIRVIVPHLAMSGGTLLSFAAKQILMGSYSSLGPTDPLFNGISAQGVCEEFDEAMKSVKENPTSVEIWKYIISKYPAAYVGKCKQAVSWSEEIATRWLKEGMFEDIEDKNKQNELVKKIVEGFGNYKKTKSHDRHFMMDQCQEMGLVVMPLDQDKELQDAVLSVHHACMYATGVTSIVKMIENHQGKTQVIIG